MKKTLLSIVAVLAFAGFANAQVPARVGWWKFDDTTNMLKAAIGSPLVLTGTQTSVPGPVAGNLATQVPLGSYFTMNHGIAANGGGDSVNVYTLQIDFSVPQIGKWHAFFQTNPTNSGGGSKGDAELFTNTSNKIGTAATGYSANAITVDTWYRMVISVKNGEFFKVYLNGELWLNGTVQAVDGRWALVNELLIFADDDGDDAEINCSELGMWNVALTDAEVAKLGGISTTVSVKENVANAVKLYPNPAENNLYLSGKPSFSKVVVYTISGSQLKEYRNVLRSINVSDLKTGVYLIGLTDANGKTVVSKFIKK